MKNFFIYILILFISLYSFSKDNSNNVFTLEKSMKEFIDLKTTITQETLNWKNDKEILKQNLNFLKQEELNLKEEKKSLNSKYNSKLEYIKQLESKKLKYKNIFQNLSELLLVIENDIDQIIKIIPISLSINVINYFNKYKHSNTLNISEKFQILLKILSEIQNIKNTIHNKKEIIKSKNGKLKEFDVLYIGLSFCYAVSNDNKDSGFGQISKEGILWNWDNSNALNIRKAIDIFNQNEIASMLELPIKLQKKGGE